MPRSTGGKFIISCSVSLEYIVPSHVPPSQFMCGRPESPASPTIPSSHFPHEASPRRPGFPTQEPGYRSLGIGGWLELHRGATSTSIFIYLDCTEEGTVAHGFILTASASMGR